MATLRRDSRLCCLCACFSVACPSSGAGEGLLGRRLAALGRLPAGLRELGYVEGVNVTIEWRWSEGFTDRLLALAIELVKQKVDVIVASGNQAVRAAQEATSAIPIVMAVSGYPDKLGLVQTLARPGGNVTRLSNLALQLQSKRLELLKEITKGLARRVALESGEPSRVVCASGAAGHCWRSRPDDPVYRSPRSRRLSCGSSSRGSRQGRRPDGPWKPRQLQGPPRHRGLRPQKSTPEYFRRADFRGGGRPYVVRAELRRDVPARCDLRGQNPQGREACRSSGRAAHYIRTRHQPEDREGSRADGTTIGAHAGRPRHRVNGIAEVAATLRTQAERTARGAFIVLPVGHRPRPASRAERPCSAATNTAACQSRHQTSAPSVHRK